MKKLAALILSLLMLFSFAACKKEEEKQKEKPAHSIDVEYYAKIGQIPEHKYHIGSSAEDMKEAFKKEGEELAESSEDEHIHDVYSFIEEDDYCILVYESANYYYKDDGKISAVISLDSSYDFKIGYLPKQITDVLGESELKKGDKETIFFLPMPDNYKYLEYTFGENTLLFVFEQNALCATALIGPNF